MAHRAIICAALANGTSVIKNVAYSQDIKTTIAGMQQLGADIRMEEDQVTVTGIKNFTVKDKMCIRDRSSPMYIASTRKIRFAALRYPCT